MVIGHTIQGADYTLQLRGKLQTARLAGHQQQANPDGLNNLHPPVLIKDTSLASFATAFFFGGCFAFG